MPAPYRIAFQSINRKVIVEDCAILIHGVFHFFEETNEAANILTHLFLIMLHMDDRVVKKI